MIPSEAQAVAVVSLAHAQDALALSGAYTGIVAEGEIVIIEDVGEITGSFTGILYTATDAAGAGATAVTFEDGSVFVRLTTSGHITKKVMNARQNLGFLGYLTAITTGPIHVSVSAIYRPKTTT
jgi:hypothetical protein